MFRLLLKRAYRSGVCFLWPVDLESYHMVAYKPSGHRYSNHEYLWAPKHPSRGELGLNAHASVLSPELGALQAVLYMLMKIMTAKKLRTIIIILLIMVLVRRTAEASPPFLLLVSHGASCRALSNLGFRV